MSNIIYQKAQYIPRNPEDEVLTATILDLCRAGKLYLKAERARKRRCSLSVTDPRIRFKTVYESNVTLPDGGILGFRPESVELRGEFLDPSEVPSIEIVSLSRWKETHDNGS